MKKLMWFASLAAGVAASSFTHAQGPSLKDQVVGSWQYVSVDLVRADGSRTPLFGPDPDGMAVFDGSGHYILLTSRHAQPRFAANNREQGTDDENKAVVRGSIAHFGSYEVNEAAHSITFHIQTSTFPNWNGTNQTRPITVSGDTLRWVTPASTGAGSAEVVLRRLH
jgi:hypothetical protein